MHCTRNWNYVLYALLKCFKCNQLCSHPSLVMNSGAKIEMGQKPFKLRWDRDYSNEKWTGSYKWSGSLKRIIQYILMYNKIAVACVCSKLFYCFSRSNFSFDSNYCKFHYIGDITSYWPHLACDFLMLCSLVINCTCITTPNTDSPRLRVTTHSHQSLFINRSLCHCVCNSRKTILWQNMNDQILIVW